jgi:hypothetical protein
MAEIRMRTKVMPSIGTGVRYEMEWTDVEEPNFEQQLSSGLRDELKDFDISYHVFNGDTSLMFPTLFFNEQSVPAGNAGTKCVHVTWTELEFEGVDSQYNSVQGLPKCENLNAMWPSHDPKTGINIASWKQFTIDLNCKLEK